MTALMWAAHRGDEAIVRTLLRRGADASLESLSGWSALTFAAAGGDVKTVRALLKGARGVDMEHADAKAGRTPLIYAAQVSDSAV